MTVDEELDKLQKLRDAGTITDEQYERARTKLLDGEPPVADEVRDDTSAPHEDRRPRRRDRDEDDAERRPVRSRRKKVRDWSMVLHLSLLAGHTVPLGGIIAPIVIWQTQKEEMPELDEHGRNAVNWMISSIIYLLVSLPLCLVGIGFVTLIVLGVLSVVFPVIAAIKASEDRAWRYPLSITFFK